MNSLLHHRDNSYFLNMIPSHPTLMFHPLAKNQDRIHKNIKTIVHRRNLSSTNSVQSNRERVVIARWS